MVEIRGRVRAIYTIKSTISYQETFFVPEKARWVYIRDQLQLEVEAKSNRSAAHEFDATRILVERN